MGGTRDEMTDGERERMNKDNIIDDEQRKPLQVQKCKNKSHGHR